MNLIYLLLKLKMKIHLISLILPNQENSKSDKVSNLTMSPRHLEKKFFLNTET